MFNIIVIVYEKNFDFSSAELTNFEFLDSLKVISLRFSLTYLSKEVEYLNSNIQIFLKFFTISI